MSATVAPAGSNTLPQSAPSTFGGGDATHVLAQRTEGEIERGRSNARQTNRVASAAIVLSLPPCVPRMGLSIARLHSSMKQSHRRGSGRRGVRERLPDDI